MLRSQRPARPVAPPVKKIAVPRAFVIDFNRVDHFYDWGEAERATAKARVRAERSAYDDIAPLAAVLRALDVVARHYGWDAAERAEWRAPLRHPGPARDFIATLALALQHGYRQTPANNYQRLNPWLAGQGLAPITT